MLKTMLYVAMAALLAASCASKKKIIYLQGTPATSQSVTYQNAIQPDDNLIITVTSDSPELASPFNLVYLNKRSTELVSTSNEALISYLVDQNGEIEFPILGKIKLAGLTKVEAENKLKDLLKKYITNPGVNLRVTNFKISVIGEVVRSGQQFVVGDRITLLEAISQAGDMTIYGNRKEVMIIREKDGVKTTTTVDLTSSDLINSPYYYLAHNDLVYVQPNKTRINSSVIGPNLTVGISAISLLITILVFATR